jgi:hypothetical protein
MVYNKIATSIYHISEAGIVFRQDRQSHIEKSLPRCIGVAGTAFFARRDNG